MDMATMEVSVCYGANAIAKELCNFCFLSAIHSSTLYL